MARIYQPRQRTDKRWDMTVGSDEEGWVHPIGYCAGWFEWTEELASRIGYSLDACLRDQAAQLPYKSKFHKDGHTTSEEASACWRAYHLDTELEFHDLPDEQHKCQVCSAWTQRVAELGHEFTQRFHVCLDHATREFVAKLDDDRRQARRAR